MTFKRLPPSAPLVSRTRGLLVSSAVVVLAACGGSTGGGGGTTPAQPQFNPAPPPAPSPTFTPPPAIPAFEDAEYGRSTGLGLIGASRAYQAGATGQGITVGVIDSGVDITSPEFTGRLHPGSADIVSGRSLQDPDGHGTYVAAIIGAARNGISTHGVAYNARLLIARSDEGNSCATDCVHNDNDIAAGIDLAVNNGARVINISLGGSPPNSRLFNAIDRATRAGTILVFSAGNDSSAQADQFATAVIQSAAARGLALAVGAGTAQGVPASFSNAAGSVADSYLLAPGTSIRVRGLGGTDLLVSGTSFSAPHVAGALAVLLQAFPSLTARQAVDLLLNSATDLGAPGTDAVFGRGFLNLARAFQPQGQSSVQTPSGTPAPLALAGSNVQLGSAFGDAKGLGAALAGVTFLDGYGRAFSGDLGLTVRQADAALNLAGWIGRRMVADRLAAGERVALSFAARTLLTSPDGVRASYRAGPGFVTGRVQADVSLGGGRSLSIAQGADGRALAGLSAAKGFITADGLGLSRHHGADDRAVGLTQSWGPWQLTLAASAGRRTGWMADGVRLEGREQQVHVRLANTTDTTRWALGLSQISERGAVLGSVGRDSLGLGSGASTTLLSGQLGRWLSDRVHVDVMAALGTTDIRSSGRGLISGIDSVILSGLQADVTWLQPFGTRDQLGLRVLQPLRVERAQAALRVPVGFDYGTGTSGFETRRASLTPSGRELAFEARYATGFARDGQLGVNLFHRLNPGHRADARPDSGAAIEVKLEF
jgi:hypothetical protein